MAPPSTVNWYVPYPPAGDETVIVPSFAPKHVTFVLENAALRTAGSVMANAGLIIITHAGLAASLILRL